MAMIYVRCKTYKQQLDAVQAHFNTATLLYELGYSPYQNFMQHLQY